MTTIAATPSYANPLARAKGLVAERVDEGVDYAMTPGSPIAAIGDGIVTGITPWYKGQPYLEYQLTSGPLAGQRVYLAEQITPTVKQGDKITAGQTIATYASSGTGLETGFASSALGTAYAAGPGGGYQEGQRTAAGQLFSDLLVGLGAPAGAIEGRPVTGTVSPQLKTAAGAAGSAGGLTIPAGASASSPDVHALDLNPLNPLNVVGDATSAAAGIGAGLAGDIVSALFDAIAGKARYAALAFVVIIGGFVLVGKGLNRATHEGAS